MATPPVFSAGAVLTAAQMNAVGMWQITPTSVAGTGVTLNGASIDMSASTTASVNGVFTDDFDNYQIRISVVGSVGGNAYNMRLRASGSDNTNASYFYYGFYWTSSATNLTTTAATGWFLNNRSTGTSYDNCIVDIFNPKRAVLTSHQVRAMEVNTGLLIQTGGFFNGTTSFDGFSIYTGSGTMTGKIQVFGFRQ